MKKLILGSKSPRRYEILKNAGFDFEVIETECEEKTDFGQSFPEIVKSISKQKNDAVLKMNFGDAIVLTADTMVVLESRILGKPKNETEAAEFLRRLSGNTHSVLTGFCITDTKSGRRITDCEETKVTFTALSEKEIEEYIKTGEPMDKAGAYGIQNRGSVFVEKIEGDYFNVVGLPICEISKLLKSDFEYFDL